MSEPRAPYVTSTDPPPPKLWRCSCGATIGVLVDVNGRVWLQIANVELRNGHGRCTRCKAVWHYDDLDYVMERMVEHE